MASILVCDDEPLVVELLSSTFESRGYLVPVARNGGEAIALTRLHRPDLLLLDVRLPDMSGIEVLREVRARTGEDGPSAIFLSGLEDPALMAEARSLGAVDYLTKNALRTEELLKSVQRHTQRTEGSTTFPGGAFDESMPDPPEVDEAMQAVQDHSRGICQVAGWTLRHKIGRGGMGDVYLAQKGPTRAAAKILPRHHDLESEVAGRFQREIGVLQRLRHPHVIGYIESGMADLRPYLMMELVWAPSLQTHLEIRDDTLSPREGRAILEQLSSALADAWEEGITHRDIKPANILMAPPRSGHAEPFRSILCDFGLARIKESFADIAGDEVRTEHGYALGTPAYMSPEQARGISVSDQRQDIYALGATLYRALTGRRLFGMASMARKVTEDPDLSALSGVDDPQLTELIGSMVQREPERRIPTWQAVLGALA